MDLPLELDRRTARTLSQQVADGIRRLVEEGVLRPGEALPSSRELALSLGVARNTVIAAYEQLVDSGHVRVESRRRPLVSAALVAPRERQASSDPGSDGELPGRLLVERFGPSYDLGPELPVDFRLGTPALNVFPERAWLQAYRHALGARTLLYSHDPQGSERLRAAVATHLVRSRGVKAAHDQILITTGTQQALALVARFVLTPDDAVVMEDPGYLTARRLFQSLGARILPVPVDDEGLRTDALPPARMAYITPSHQFPLGGVLPLGRRQALLLWAQARGAYVVEDDYDGEFRFGLPPLPALQGLDRVGRVFYLGTFSKVLAPGLRLGFIVAPPLLAAPLAEFRALTERPPDGVSQEALAEFIENGAFEAHLRRMRRLYAERRHAARALLGEHLPPDWRVVGSDAGLHIPVVYEGSRRPDLARLSRKLRARGIMVETLAPYAIASPRTGLVLSYGTLAEEELLAGLRAITQVMRELCERRRE